mgnify:FL=1
MDSSDQLYGVAIMNYFITYLYKYVCPVFYLLGIIGNLISMIIFFIKSWRKNVCVFYLTCYLFFNICYLTFHSCVRLLNFILPYSPPESNNILCKLFLYAYYLLATLPGNVLIFASIDRLLISSQNVDTRLYSSKRLAYFSISISSIIWMIYYSHLLAKSHIQQVVSNDYVCTFDQSEPYLSFVYYSLVGTVLVSCLIVIIVCILSFKNVRSIRALPRQQRTRQVRSMTKKDFQLLRCLYALDHIYAFFILLSTIYDLCNAFLLQTQAETLFQQTLYNFLSSIFTFLTLIPYVSNLGIFMIISKAFRHEVKRICYKMIGKTITSFSEDENNAQINIFATIAS